jgi:replication initiation protein RepC
MRFSLGASCLFDKGTEMTDKFATTPFGGARLTVRHFARQNWVKERQTKLSTVQDKTDGDKVDKWQLLRALTEARHVYDLSDRSITVLEALTSFHQARELDGASPIIVFPSNTELSMRTRGMSPATLRRHLAALVAAGLIFRRDSPNGKRYCRRDAAGKPQEMFGFDLAPLALRAKEIHSQAEAIRADHRERQALRCEITIHLRDLSKTIFSALSEERAGDFEGYQRRLDALSGRVARNAEKADLLVRRDSLVKLRAEVENTYLASLSQDEMSANGCEYEHHIQNSETDIPEERSLEKSDVNPQTVVSVSLDRILKSCPQIADYSRDGIETWTDLVSAASLVRSMLGISPPVWQRARATMGSKAAAVVVAAMLERASQIRSSGGYLRTLTDHAARGKFSIIPMLKALE